MRSLTPWTVTTTSIASILALSATAATAQQLDMTPGVTEISQQVFDLHRLMLYICTAIGVVVFGVMFVSMFKHRKSKGYQAAQFHESTLVEILWTIVPFIILILMAIPATRVMINQHDTSESALTVKVTGSQWKWHYEYLEYEGGTDIGLDFLSVLSTPMEEIINPAFKDGLFPKGIGEYNNGGYPEKSALYKTDVDNPLVIPTGQKVRFLITSDDVIHAWWVPDFAIKKDAIPGYINELWANVPVGKEGIYRGQCAELCGKDHAFMPIVVEAKSPTDFKQWLAHKQDEQREAEAAAANDVNKTFTMDELMAVGEEAYTARCAACHQGNGQGLPPTFPALAGSAIAIQPELRQQHIDIIVNGKNAMPAFGSVLSPKEIAAIVTYERNAWGNDTGDLVQPADVVK